jgi:uncharacterized membrane-anchored protein YhcB (DUF1043 family)
MERVKEMIQLSFLEESVEAKLQRELNELRAHVDKVRKSQYAKLGKLAKLYEEIKRDHEDFKRTLCARAQIHRGDANDRLPI